jgi:quercetin dioxygenase-like cupin family protein
MKINKTADIESKKVSIPGAENVTIQMLVGPDDGSKNIAMRKFTVAPGGHTPRHSHNYEHVIKIENNKGFYIDKDGKKHEVSEGDCFQVKANDLHQFQNPHDKPLEFLCIILNQG